MSRRLIKINHHRISAYEALPNIAPVHALVMRFKFQKSFCDIRTTIHHTRTKTCLLLQKLDHHEDSLLPDHLAHDRSPVRTRDIHESRGHYLSLMYSHIQGLLLTDLYRTIASIHHIKNNFLLKNTKNITKITRMDAYDT